MTKSMVCPFCGMKDEACYVNGLNGADVYQCQWCGAQTNCQEEWETRPLEESLRAKLARELRVSDALYLLLVDDPNTKLKADQILIDIYGKCEPSPSDVSVTQDVLMNSKTSLPVKSDELRKDDTCPDCAGSGEVGGNYGSEDGMVTCERCNGKGTI